MNRQISIDLLRGFIMLLMAIDHASAFIGRTHYFEIWGVELIPYESAGWFLTRFVSHLCAPGFFMLMGFSMIILAENRIAKNWSIAEIRKYFWKRGGVILLLMIFVEFPAWGLGFLSGEPAINTEFATPGLPNLGFPSTVLFGLGICMIVGSYLVKMKWWQLSLMVIFNFVLSPWYINNSDPDTSFNILEQILVVPSEGFLMVIYPLIPWLGVTAFGMLIAKILSKFPKKIYTWSLLTGIVFLILFAIIRIQGFGNFQIDTYNDWISFFTLIKYPPGLTFFLCTIGILLMFFFVFSKIGASKLLQPVQLFGQTAMFFYLAHLYIYGLIGFFFPNGSGLLVLYICWAIGLIPLYYLCKWYLKFKKGKPAGSIWKMI